MTDFVYTIKSHPTSYGGVNFRSRLEATWAAFFDLADIPWSYEPLDLNGWVPDFVLYGQIAVEVKPVLSMAELPDFQSDIDRIKSCGTKMPTAFVGAEPAHVANRIGWVLSGHDLEFPKLWFADGELTLATPARTDSLWKQAKNLTQWKPAK